MRIVAVVPYPPRADATHGGARAAAGLLLRLARRHPVAIAYLREASEQPLGDELDDLADTVVEVNCRPERLDPPKRLLRLAVEAGCVMSIDTDAHAPGQLDWLPYGCGRAAACAVPGS